MIPGPWVHTDTLDRHLLRYPANCATMRRAVPEHGPERNWAESVALPVTRRNPLAPERRHSRRRLAGNRAF